MSKLKSALEIAVNLALLAAAILVCTSFLNKPRTPGDPAQLVGKPWTGPKLVNASLVMAVAPTCHFCSESFPFYRQLSAARGGNVKLIALVPDKADGSAYLGSGQIGVDGIESASVRDVGAKGTPTLFLVSGGVVQQVWEGKLSPSREVEVMRAFKGE